MAGMSEEDMWNSQRAATDWKQAGVATLGQC